jgi:hypothetical protein
MTFWAFNTLYVSMNFVSSLDSNATRPQGFDEDDGKEEEMEIMLTVCSI